MIFNKLKTKFNLYSRLLTYFTSRQKYQLIFLLFLISIGAVLELLTVVLIIPFINILNGEELPKVINNLISNFQPFLDISEAKNLILLIAAVVLTISLISSFFRILITILKENYISKVINFLITKAFNNILNQKYSWHSKNESSEIIVKTDFIDAISGKILGSILLIFTSIISSLIILLGMFVYNFKTTFSALFLVSFCYFVFLLWCKNRLDNNSIGRVKERKKLLKIKKDALNGIREIIINNEKELVLKPFKLSDKKLRDYQAEIGYLSLFPRYVIEFLAIVVILIVGIFAFNSFEKSDSIITAIAFFSISLLKLIPQIQSFYSSITSLRANNKPFSEFLDLLALDNDYINKSALIKEINADTFVVKNLTYYLSNSQKPLFKNFNLNLKKGDFIALTGKSGVGKTTLCDLLMGLIEPNSGEFIFKSKNNNYKITPYDLRNNSVHVPQEVFIINDSIKNNIIRTSKYNKDYLAEALHISCLDQFVKSLPKGLNTEIGEKGAFISGGQKQRIGLARAIYSLLNESKFILFLDESTSALDLETEINVIKRLKVLSKNKIVMFISHRKNTFDLFNKILDLNKAKI